MGQGQPGWRSTNSPQREKVVGKAGPGQGCEWLQEPEAGCLLGSLLNMWLHIHYMAWPPLPEQQAMQKFSSQLGEHVPLQGSLVAAFLSVLLGKTEVTPCKIHLMYYRVNDTFAQGIWAGQLRESLILCDSWRQLPMGWATARSALKDMAHAQVTPGHLSLGWLLISSYFCAPRTCNVTDGGMER